MRPARLSWQYRNAPSRSLVTRHEAPPVGQAACAPVVDGPVRVRGDRGAGAARQEEVSWWTSLFRFEGVAWVLPGHALLGDAGRRQSYDATCLAYRRARFDALGRGGSSEPARGGRRRRDLPAGQGASFLENSIASTSI